eukprot:Amastigsp_a340052_137.p4 type:complete len:107 gc:universal Amastigsp_a340052_137:570-890(+)
MGMAPWATQFGLCVRCQRDRNRSSSVPSPLVPAPCRVARAARRGSPRATGDRAARGCPARGAAPGAQNEASTTQCSQEAPDGARATRRAARRVQPQPQSPLRSCET